MIRTVVDKMPVCGALLWVGRIARMPKRRIRVFALASVLGRCRRLADGEHPLANGAALLRRGEHLHLQLPELEQGVDAEVVGGDGSGEVT